MESSLNITGLNFANITLDELVNTISSKMYLNEKFIISSPNVHICNYANRNLPFMNLLNEFSVLHPDGIGVYIASKILYGKKGFKIRSTGTDLYFKLFKEFSNLNVFLIGGVENCAEKIKSNSELKNELSNINIVGSIIKLTDSYSDIETINNASVDVLMVALGTPFQEEWIIKNKDKLNVPVIIAVGSGLDFLAGVKKRAPLLMRKLGLEWFYRLFQEPRRLWKRYVFGIPVFIFHILIQKVNLMLKKV